MKLRVIGLAILGFGLLALLLNHQSGQTLGLGNDAFARLISLSAILTLIGAGLWRGRMQFGQNMQRLLIWLVILLALVVAYIYSGDLKGFGQRLAGGMMPGYAAVFTDNEGYQEVVLSKMMDGHFEANVEVDDKTLRMLVDTGASAVTLSFEDATRLGLSPDRLTFSRRVLTANGEASAAPITLDRIAIGPIERQRVAALVAEKGRLDRSLLGMSFLSTLDLLQMKTNELRLRD
ncbi:aspartic protease [Xaviernesmea oryzae]|uniref:Aspartic protease n=1 Tax=Xaviernesmea oryzae TaxID=464029 RepID=A0A1Q9B0F5_9HYPH|nr:TIGR02281 family clan AA aspartic protease [Xaviernesmea oryzae]OLP61453.1 aspartic protease [Xaviernesmea oryzae]SEL68819.1 aspartyl protease family protein [Xaviernesmea oryzae]